MTTDEQNPSAEQAPEATTYPFQAEVQKVLSLVIDSLYTHKEVFLRELVSNASDALDKARFYALTHEDAKKQEGEPRIDIAVDEEARTLTIEDNGIGMTREEVIHNLGTIARSGSAEFVERFRAAAKASSTDSDGKPSERPDALRLIGQFGVGFYAAFMVADRVDVDTLSMTAGSSPVLWRSTGTGTFTVLAGERTAPGTRIVLHLKDEQRDFLRAWRMQDVIKKYSNYVAFPIMVGGELANSPVALWTLPRAQVKAEQHAEFFKQLTSGGADDKPRLTIHLSIDAPVQFHALLYVPETAPFDMFQKENRQSLRLYAKRVLIIENCETLAPIWLRFLRGIVDSEDLSLNVSREMLQESRALNQIQQQIVKQVLKSLKDLAESEPAQYADFWRVFGKVLKEGVSTDWKHKDDIVGLCRFESMNTKEGELTSLAAYVAAMPAEQKEVYFITGLARRAVESSPHLEAFKKKGFDVLFFTDPIDEWMSQALPEFEKNKLKSVTHGDLDLGDEPAQGETPDAALSAIRRALGQRVKEVRFSKRLTDSASCLVAAEGDPGANMERILRMIDERALERKRILEVNPDHPIVKNIAVLAAAAGGETSASPPDSPGKPGELLTTYCEMLYDQALLAEGVVEDPVALVRRLQILLTQATSSAVGPDKASS